jgi:hypothetical protein
MPAAKDQSGRPAFMENFFLKEADFQSVTEENQRVSDASKLDLNATAIPLSRLFM